MERRRAGDKTRRRMPKILPLARRSAPVAGTAGRWSTPGPLRQASVLMVQLELTPTAKKTTPGHCG
jgi:hypothetical protein